MEFRVLAGVKQLNISKCIVLWSKIFLLFSSFSITNSRFKTGVLSLPTSWPPARGLQVEGEGCVQYQHISLRALETSIFNAHQMS